MVQRAVLVERLQRTKRLYSRCTTSLAVADIDPMSATAPVHVIVFPSSSALRTNESVDRSVRYNITRSPGSPTSDVVWPIIEIRSVTSSSSLPPLPVVPIWTPISGGGYPPTATQRNGPGTPAKKVSSTTCEYVGELLRL